MRPRALIFLGVAILSVALAGLALAGKKKGKSSTSRPAEVSRSSKPPSAYHVFLTEPKDNAKAGADLLKSAVGSMSTLFTRPGYIVDSPTEKAPTDSSELAKWLRDKDR